MRAVFGAHAAAAVAAAAAHRHARTAAARVPPGSLPSAPEVEAAVLRACMPACTPRRSTRTRRGKAVAVSLLRVLRPLPPLTQRARLARASPSPPSPRPLWRRARGGQHGGGGAATKKNGPHKYGNTPFKSQTAVYSKLAKNLDALRPYAGFKAVARAYKQPATERARQRE